jgi:hypothetical protein
VPLIGGITGGLTRAIKQGTYVAPYTIVNDAAAQAAQAAIEGGDGIYEVPIRDRRFVQTNATRSAPPISPRSSRRSLTARWTTTDLNARVGAQQVINICTAHRVA